jgi:hypothetical protein
MKSDVQILSRWRTRSARSAGDARFLKRLMTMMTQNVENSMNDAGCSAEFVKQTNVTLAESEPEMRSLLWMLREGVIGRRHFEAMLASALEN